MCTCYLYTTFTSFLNRPIVEPFKGILTPILDTCPRKRQCTEFQIIYSIPFARVLLNVCKKTLTHSRTLRTSIRFCLFCNLIFAFSSINPTLALVKLPHVSLFIMVVQTLTNCAFDYFAAALIWNFVISIILYKSDGEPALFHEEHFVTTRSVWRLQFIIEGLCLATMLGRYVRSPLECYFNLFKMVLVLCFQILSSHFHRPHHGRHTE